MYDVITGNININTCRTLAMDLDNMFRICYLFNPEYETVVPWPHSVTHDTTTLEL
jgi:hypothetical protein